MSLARAWKFSTADAPLRGEIIAPPLSFSKFSFDSFAAALAKPFVIDGVSEESHLLGSFNGELLPCSVLWKTTVIPVEAELGYTDVVGAPAGGVIAGSIPDGLGSGGSTLELVFWRSCDRGPCEDMLFALTVFKRGTGSSSREMFLREIAYGETRMGSGSDVDEPPLVTAGLILDGEMYARVDANKQRAGSVKAHATKPTTALIDCRLNRYVIGGGCIDVHRNSATLLISTAEVFRATGIRSVAVVAVCKMMGSNGVLPVDLYLLRLGSDGDVDGFIMFGLSAVYRALHMGSHVNGTSSTSFQRQEIAFALCGFAEDAIDMLRYTYGSVTMVVRERGMSAFMVGSRDYDLVRLVLGAEPFALHNSDGGIQSVCCIKFRCGNPGWEAFLKTFLEPCPTSASVVGRDLAQDFLPLVQVLILLYNKAKLCATCMGREGDSKGFWMETEAVGIGVGVLTGEDDTLFGNATCDDTRETLLTYTIHGCSAGKDSVSMTHYLGSSLTSILPFMSVRMKVTIESTPGGMTFVATPASSDQSVELAFIFRGIGVEAHMSGGAVEGNGDVPLLALTSKQLLVACICRCIILWHFHWKFVKNKDNDGAIITTVNDGMLMEVYPLKTTLEDNVCEWGAPTKQ